MIDADPTQPRLVELRDVHGDDLPLFFEHQSDPDATRIAAFSRRPHPRPRNTRHCMADLEDWQRGPAAS